MFYNEQDCTVTEHGRNMASLPLEPVYANLLLASQKFGCVHMALCIDDFIIIYL